MKIVVEPKNALTFEKLESGDLFYVSIDSSHRLVYMKIATVHLLNRDREAVNSVCLSNGMLMYTPHGQEVVQIKDAQLKVSL